MGNMIWTIVNTSHPLSVSFFPFFFFLTSVLNMEISLTGNSLCFQQHKVIPLHKSGDAPFGSLLMCADAKHESKVWSLAQTWMPSPLRVQASDSYPSSRSNVILVVFSSLLSMELSWILLAFWSLLTIVPPWLRVDVYIVSILCSLRSDRWIVKSRLMGWLMVSWFWFGCITLIGFSYSLIKLVPKTESLIGLSRWKILFEQLMWDFPQMIENRWAFDFIKEKRRFLWC